MGFYAGTHHLDSCAGEKGSGEAFLHNVKRRAVPSGTACGSHYRFVKVGGGCRRGLSVRLKRRLFNRPARGTGVAAQPWLHLGRTQLIEKVLQWVVVSRSVEIPPPGCLGQIDVVGVIVGLVVTRRKIIGDVDRASKVGAAAVVAIAPVIIPASLYADSVEESHLDSCRRCCALYPKLTVSASVGCTVILTKTGLVKNAPIMYGHPLDRAIAAARCGD